MATDCHCESCTFPPGALRTHMVLCPYCGNKRCPHAESHTWACSGSNKLNQTRNPWTGPPLLTPAPPPDTVSVPEAVLRKAILAADCMRNRYETDGWRKNAAELRALLGPKGAPNG